MSRRPKPTSLPPDLVRFVAQSGIDADCGITSLAMLLGLTRTEAMTACGAIQPAAAHSGMYPADLVRVATALGRTVKWRRRCDLEEGTGVLSVGKSGEGHFVFLWEGRIVDGNGELWLDAESYLKHYGYVAAGLLVLA